MEGSITTAPTYWHRRQSPRYWPGYMIGSEGDGGEHRRDLEGWPFSVYIAAREMGATDVVVAHGIQHHADAEAIRAALSALQEDTL